MENMNQVNFILIQSVNDIHLFCSYSMAAIRLSRGIMVVTGIRSTFSTVGLTMGAHTSALAVPFSPDRCNNGIFHWCCRVFPHCQEPTAVLWVSFQWCRLDGRAAITAMNSGLSVPSIFCSARTICLSVFMLGSRLRITLVNSACRYAWLFAEFSRCHTDIFLDRPS